MPAAGKTTASAAAAEAVADDAEALAPLAMLEPCELTLLANELALAEAPET